MDQHTFLRYLRFIVVMTHGYLKCGNVYLLIYRGYLLNETSYLYDFVIIYILSQQKPLNHGSQKFECETCNSFSNL